MEERSGIGQGSRSSFLLRNLDFFTPSEQAIKGTSETGDETASYFLNSRSNAERASLADRGASAGGVGGWALSRATVTRAENREHSFAPSLTGIRTGMGFKH